MKTSNKSSTTNGTKKKTKGELYLERMDREEQDPNVRPEVTDSSSSDSDIDFAEVFKHHANRFRFAGFREQISKVDINVFLPPAKGASSASSSSSGGRRVDEVSTRQASPSEGATFFSEALVRWRDHDTSIPYATAYSELIKLCQSLPIELLNRDKIIDTILAHLGIEPRTPSYKALLNLLAHLARDLRSEFYPRLFDVLDFLVQRLLDPADPALLEAVFTTMSYLFKFLQRQLVEDIEKVVDWYRALVGHWKDYVRSFAAESAAFLLRKVPPTRTPAVITKVFGLVADIATENAANGVAALLFETLRGSKGVFFSGAAALLPLIFAQLAYDPTEKETLTKLKFLTVWRLAKLMQRHVRSVRNGLIWTPVTDAIRSSIDRFTEQSKGENNNNNNAGLLLFEGERIALFMSIMSEWIGYHNGAIVPPRAMAVHVAGVLRAVFSSNIDARAGPNCHLQALRLLENLFLLTKLVDEGEGEGEKEEGSKMGAVEYSTVSSIVGLALSPPRTPEAIFTFCMTRKRRDEDTFRRYVFSNLAAYLAKNTRPENYPATLAFVEQLEASNINNGVYDSKLSAENSVLAKIIIPILVKVLSSSSSSSSSYDGKRTKYAHLVWAVYRIVPTFVPAFTTADAKTIYTSAMADIRAYLNESTATAKEDKGHKRRGRLVAYEAFNSISCLLSAEKVSKDVSSAAALREIFVGLVRIFRTSPAFLRVAHAFLQVNGARVSDKGELFRELMGTVTENFYSKNRDLRLASVRLLEPVAPSTEAAEALAWCDVVEATPLTVATIRDFTVNLEFIERKVRAGTFPTEVFPMIVPFVLGTLHIKFSPVWPFSKTALLTLFKNHCAETWPCFIKQLEASEAELLAFWKTSSDPAAAAAFVDAQEQNQESAESEEDEEEQQPPAAKRAKEGDKQALSFIPESIVNRRERENVGYKGLNELYGDAREASEHNVPPYTDIFTYNGMLWAVLENVSDVIEKEDRSEKIVTFFMNFAQQNKATIFRFMKEKSDIIGDNDEDEDDEMIEGDDDDDGDDEKKSVDELFSAAAKRRKPTGEQMAKMSCFLRVFSRVKKPQAIYRSADLQAIFTRMLEIPSLKTQRQALSCLMAWRVHSLRPYRPHFMRLLREGTFRDELARFQIGDPKVVDPAHRHIVAETLVHLLCPFLTRRINKHGKGISLRQNALAFLATFADDDLPLVLERIVAPIEQFIAGSSLERSPLKDLQILLDTLGNLNGRARPFFTRIFDIVLHFLAKCETTCTNDSDAFSTGEGGNSKKNKKNKKNKGEKRPNSDAKQPIEEEKEKDADGDEEMGVSNRDRYIYSYELRSVCVKLFDKLTLVFPDEFKSGKTENTTRMSRLVEVLGGYIATNLDYSKAREPSGLFNCFLTMSCSEHTLPFVAQNALVFPGMVSYIASTNATHKSNALSFVENILELAPTCPPAKDMLTANASVVLRGLKQLFVQKNRRKGGRSHHRGATESCSPQQRQLRQRAIKVLAAVGLSNAHNIPASELNEITLLILDFVLAVRQDEVKEATTGEEAHRANEEMVMGFMHIVDQIFEAVRPSRAVILRVASLLQRPQDRKLRVCIAAVFAKIAAALPGFADIGRFVADINAYSIKSLSKIYDYDTRQRAFNMILENDSSEKDEEGKSKGGFLTRMSSHLEYFIVYSSLIHNAFDADSSMRENAIAALNIFFAVLARKYGPDFSVTPTTNTTAVAAVDGKGEGVSTRMVVVAVASAKEIRKLVTKEVYESVCDTLLRSFKESNFTTFASSFAIFRMLGVHFPTVFPDFVALSTPVRAPPEHDDDDDEDEEMEAEIEAIEKSDEEEAEKEEKEEEKEETEEEEKEEKESTTNVDEETTETPEEEEGKILFGKCFIPHFSDFSFEAKVKALDHFCAVLDEEIAAGRGLRKIRSLWLPLFIKIAENYDVLFRAENQAFLEALGRTIARVHETLEWPAYYTSVMGLIKTADKLVEEKKGISNILISIVCKVLEKFHFEVASKAQVDEEEKESNSNNKKKGKKKTNADVRMENDDDDNEDDYFYDEDEENDNDDDEEGNDDEVEAYDKQYKLIQLSLKLEEVSANLTLAVQANVAINQQFVPILMRKLTEGKDEDLGPQRMALARAVVRLLLLLPNREGDGGISQLIIVLCQTLQSKDDPELRENARAALCDVTARLGPTYFGKVVRELRFALKRGLQLHVLGYTMNKVLASIYAETERLYKQHMQHQEENSSPCDQNVFDSVIPDIVDVLFEDLIGITGRQKAIREIAKGKKQQSSDNGPATTVVEVGKSTAYQSFRLLAALAQFGDPETNFGGIGLLLRPIVDRIRNNDIGNDVAKLNVFVDVLKHVAMGIGRNRTTTTKVLLEFSYVLIKNNILPSDKEKKAAAAAARKRMTPEELEQERRASNPRYIAMQEAKKKFLVFKNLSGTKKKIANEAASNAYIIANFGFSLLEFVVKKLGKRLSRIDNAQTKEVANDDKDNTTVDVKTEEEEQQQQEKEEEEETVIKETNVNNEDEEMSSDDEDSGMEVEKKTRNRNRNYLDDGAIVGLINPFVKILVKCLNSNQQAGVIQSAISVLSVLAPHKSIPSVVESSRKIITKTIAIIKLGAASSSGLVCSCLRMLTTLFAHGYYRGVEERHVTAVIDYAAAQLTEVDTKYSGSHPDAVFLLAILGFLQAVVGQRLVTPKVYDMVDIAASLSVISPVAEVRTICAHIALTFFEVYPASNARKEQVLDFFVKNTEYEVVDGRRSALETVHAIFLGLASGNPGRDADRKLLGNRIEVTYLTLINRFINEPEMDLKSFILRRVLPSFVAVFERDEAQLNLLLTLTFNLLCNSKKVLIKQAILQLTSVFLSVTPKNFINRYKSVALPYVSEVLSAAAALTTKTVEDEARKESDIHHLYTLKHISTAAERQQQQQLPTFKDWEIVYHALGSLERIISANNAFAFDSKLRPVWDDVLTLFAYRHAWVQHICIRLISGVLARLDPRKLAETIVEKKGDSNTTLFVLSIDFIYAVGTRIVGHIGGDYTSEQSLNCALKLLASITNIFALCNNSAIPTAVAKDTKTKERKNKKAARNRRKDKGKGKSKEEEEREEEEEEEEGANDSGEKEAPKNFLPLFKLLSNFSKLTELVSSPKRCVIFKWFAALVLILTKSKKLGPRSLSLSTKALDTDEKILAFISKPKSDENHDTEKKEVEAEAEEESAETMEEEGLDFVKKSIFFIMRPLYRSINEAKTVIQNEKSIVKGTLKIVRDALGDKSYFEAYNAVRSEASRKSEVTEQAKKRLAILDPKRNSKEKLKDEKKHSNPAMADKGRLIDKLRKRGIVLKVISGKKKAKLRSDTTPMAKPRNPMKK